MGGAITINDAAPATPYPSNCVVSGMSGAITDVNVQFNGLSHTYPDDIDMLLVSPGGQNAIFMSDAGGSNELVNCDLTIDDQAAQSLPDTDGFTCPGSYQPANYEPGDPFPAPAPTPSGNVNLSTFDGGTGERDVVAVRRRRRRRGCRHITSWSLRSRPVGLRHRLRLRLRLRVGRFVLRCRRTSMAAG